MISLLIAVALGGAIGSSFRFLVSYFLPFGTLIVNLTGSFLIGLISALVSEKFSVSPELRLLLITGMLGGFTTFSTFSYESVSLLVGGEFLKFLLYVFGTNAGCFLLTFLGYMIGRLF